MGESDSSAEISRYAASDQHVCCAENQVQEAAVYADMARRNDAWSALPQIDNRIPMKWILPSYETSIVQSYELAQEAVWRRPENATNAVISTGTHLVSLIYRHSLYAHVTRHTKLVQDSPREVGKLFLASLLRR